MAEAFQIELDRLRQEIVAQGARVLRAVTLAFDASIGGDESAAKEIHVLEDEIDRVDVAIERHAVRAMSEASNTDRAIDERQVRSLLMIVKINNELEGIADLGVDLVDRRSAVSDDAQMPMTVRVMTNSTIGIVRDTSRAVEKADPSLANIVLKCEDAMESFRTEVLHNAEREANAGNLSIEIAQYMQLLAARCVSIADHCTNIAQQIIYAETGKIVRHTGHGWIDVTQAD